MTSGKKIALSLLISVIAFSTFVVVSFTGLFSLIEIKFYQPRVIKSIENNISTITQYHTEYTSSLIERFTNYANEKDIQSFLDKEVSASVQKSRLQLTGSLISETTGLLGLRVMDNTGRHIHYSTFTKNGQDLKNQNSKQLSYLDYGKSQTQPYSSISFNDIKVEENQQFKVTYYVNKDDQGKKKETCIIYAVPFFDDNAIRKGTVFFYCDNSGFNRYLLAKNLVSFNGTSVSFASDDCSTGGIVFGLTDIPLINTNTLEEKIISLWQAESPLDVKDINIEEFAENNSKRLHLFTQKDDSGTFISYIFDDSHLEMAQEAKILLLSVIFITLFLTVFLLLNLKHDDMTIIRDRIKRFQLAFITEFIDKKERGEIQSLPAGLSERKNELTAEIKKSLGKRGEKHSAEVEKLLESSWNEILTALGVKTVSPLLANKAVIDSDELRAILEDILGSGKLKINAASIQSPSPVTVTEPVKTKSAPAVKAEELDDAEVIEEVAEAEELDEVEEIEEVAEAEELDEVEVIEEVAEAEELDEVEEIEEMAEAEEFNDAEVIEEVADAEELDEVEVIEEAAEAYPQETSGFKEAEDDFMQLAESVSTKIDAETEDIMIEEMIFSSPARKTNSIVEELQEIANFNAQAMDFSFLDEEEDDFDEQSQPDPILPEEIAPEETEQTPLSEEDNETDSFSIEKFEPVPPDFEDSANEFEATDEEFQIEEELETTLPEEISVATTVAEEPVTDNTEVTEPFAEEVEESVEAIAAEIDDIGDETVTEAEDAEEVQPLQSEKDSNPFLFTTFAANNNNITDLQIERKDAIIEEEDGTFSIEYNEEETADIKLDDVFKKLVDSVLK